MALPSPTQAPGIPASFSVASGLANSLHQLGWGLCGVPAKLRRMKGLGVPWGRVGPTGVARAGPQFAPSIDCPWERKW